MQALTLDDVLEFANAHCVKLTTGPDTAGGGNGGNNGAPAAALNNSLPASQLRHSLKTVPIFAADGQSVRLKGAQEKLLKRSVLDGAEERSKAALVRSELKRKTKAKQVGPPPTAGKQWFDVPNTPLTPEIEKTFKLDGCGRWCCCCCTHERRAGVSGACEGYDGGMHCRVAAPLTRFRQCASRSCKRAVLCQASDHANTP